jgi:hypothetical protein
MGNAVRLADYLSCCGCPGRPILPRSGSLMSRTIEASGEHAGWRDAPVAVGPGRSVLPASAPQVGAQLPRDLDPHLDQVLARPAQRRSAQRHQLRRWRASSCGSFLRQPRWRLPVAVLAWAAHSAGAAAGAAGGRLALLRGAPRDGAAAAGRAGDLDPAGPGPSVTRGWSRPGHRRHCRP